jgi:hypothetical protein
MALPAAAQQDSAKAPAGWKHTMVAGLNLSQVGFTDWAQGGDNALSWTGLLDGKSVSDQLTTTWATTYKFAFGQARLAAQGIRKTEDKIDLETVLTYKLGTLINPYAAATVKTQFAPGYTYSATGTATEVSRFWDPGYLTQSLGAGYQPAPEVKTRLGVALRESFASTYFAYTDDPATTAIEKSRVEGGMESVTDVEWHFAQNMVLTSKIELFAPFVTFDEVVVRNDNMIAAKVNEYIAVTFSLTIIHEPRISRRTQLKEVLSLGLTYALL